MGIQVGDNFDHKSKKPLDARTSYNTVALMKAVVDANINEGCLAYCAETDKYYKFLSTNEVDETLGKWREFSSGVVSDYTTLTNKPTINNVTLDGNKTTSDLGISYDDLADKPDIPSKTSDLTNDSDFATMSDLPTATSDLTNDSGFITANDVPTSTSELTNDSGFITANDVPTSTSELINDAGFITNAVSNLVSYYLKSETYSKVEVDTIANNIKNSRFEVVNTLPTEDIKTNVIYLVPKSTSGTDNVKDEYINFDGTTAGWEKIGDTDIDLSDYVTTTALNTALADYVETTDLNTILADYVQASDLATVATSGDYDDLSNKPSIPSATSDLTNDSGFITASDVPTATSELTNDSGFVVDSDLAAVATSGDYDDLLNKPTIPTTTSELTNDSGFVVDTSLSAVATSGDYQDLANTPDPVQYSVMPTASAENIGKIVQYIGATGAYQNGFYYKCVSDGELEPTYTWEQKDVQPSDSVSAELTSDLTTVISVGGIDSGVTYEAGTPLEDLFRDLLVPTLYPTLTAPSAILSYGSEPYYAVGATVGALTATLSLNRGTINPAYGTSGYRSGAATNFAVSTSGADTEFSDSSDSSGSFAVPTLTRSTKGTIVLTGTVSYGAGEQPKDSKGGDYNTPLAAGSVSATKTLNFILPYYYGASSSASVASFAGLTQSVSAKGNKTYNFTTNNQYLVFAYDSSYGNIKNIIDGNGFDVTSGWTKNSLTVDGFSYFVYVSNSPTTDTNAAFTFKY